MPVSCMSYYVIGLISTPINHRIYRVDDIEDDSQLRRGIPGLSAVGDTPEGVVDPIQSRIKFTVSPRPSIPPIMYTS
jgi:hypothetical protein